MINADRNPPPGDVTINAFLEEVSFVLPEGFLDFFKEADGADIRTNGYDLLLWPISKMIQLNQNYDTNEYAPDFFLFGSDGGGNAYAIEKTTGYIFELPFIGMSKEEAVFKSKTFTEFIGL